MTAEIRLTEFPASWMSHVDALTGDIELDFTGFNHRITLTAAELERVYFPLLALLRSQAKATSKRVIAGLAGIPGSGKSTFAAALKHVSSAVLGPNQLDLIGLDGWHWNNFIHEHRMMTDVDGSRVPMKNRKGCSESFYVADFVHMLRTLKLTEAPCQLPVYSRLAHEPLKDGQCITAEPPVLLAEGNYLLLQSPPWDEAHAELQPCFFLECDRALARERVIHRHIQGGYTPAEAEARFNRNDFHNTDTVLASISQSNYRIRLAPSPCILGQYSISY